jgi:hypothetical protein
MNIAVPSSVSGSEQTCQSKETVRSIWSRALGRFEATKRRNLMNGGLDLSGRHQSARLDRIPAPPGHHACWIPPFASTSNVLRLLLTLDDQALAVEINCGQIGLDRNRAITHQTADVEHHGVIVQVKQAAV